MPDNVTTATVRIDDVYGPNQYGFYDIKATGQDGQIKLSTKKDELARQAQGGKGGYWQVAYTTRVKGEYTNHYLASISGIPNVDVAGPAPAEPPKPGGRGRSPDEETRIMRQSALERAIRAFGPMKETDAVNDYVTQVMLLSERFLEYFRHGPSPLLPGDDDDVPF